MMDITTIFIAVLVLVVVVMGYTIKRLIAIGDERNERMGDIAHTYVTKEDFHYTICRTNEIIEQLHRNKADIKLVHDLIEEVVR